jgi:hypothetical protein
MGNGNGNEVGGNKESDGEGSNHDGYGNKGGRQQRG